MSLRARLSLPLSRDLTCRAFSSVPGPPQAPAEGPEGVSGTAEREGRGFPAGRVARPLVRLLGSCLRAPKSNPRRAGGTQPKKIRVPAYGLAAEVAATLAPVRTSQPFLPYAIRRPLDQEWPPRPRGAARLPRPALREPASRKSRSKGTSVRSSGECWVHRKGSQGGSEAPGAASLLLLLETLLPVFLAGQTLLRRGILLCPPPLSSFTPRAAATARAWGSRKPAGLGGALWAGFILFVGVARREAFFGGVLRPWGVIYIGCYPFFRCTLL